MRFLKIASALLVIVAAGFAGLQVTGAMTEAAAPEAQARATGDRSSLSVETTQPRDMTFAEEIHAIGTARAVRAVDILPEVSGRVSEVLFSPGQRVEQGEVLLRLDSTSQSAEVRAAEATVAETRAALRRQDLLRQNGTVAEAALEAARAAALRAEADLDLARAAMEDRTIRAPFSGVVGLSDLVTGSVVDSGTLVTTLDDPSVIEIAFSLPEQHLSRIRPGLPVTLTTNAWPDRRFEGEVAAVAPRIDAASRSLAVRARIANPDGALAGGMFMEVHLTLDERRNPAVPELALIVEGPESFVYTFEAGQAKRVEVVTGATRESDVEIVEGLSDADTVIVSNLQSVEDGQPVQPQRIQVDLEATR
jgi:membrane fusion protein, multidrug efflux system